MNKWLKLFGLAYVFTVFLWVFNVTEGVGANTHSGYVELPNTNDVVPNLYVNGNLQTPLASSQQDVLISFCSSKQEWKLLQEFSNWDNVNRFGYYTDLGVGHNTVLVFRGPDAAGAKDTTYITAGARIGLWLLNDQNGNGRYDGSDSYLFSERMLTQGSVAGEHQWFMVYDVSAFKGTGATYFFDTFTEDFTTSGDFDYLIYIDDDHTDANMDHNDMIVGAISLGNPPVITAPDSTKILSNPDTIRFTVTATDIDAGDSLTLQKISGPGTFNTVTGTSPLSGQLKYYVSASGTYNFIFKATDKCGKVDYDTATYVITINTPNTPPTVTAPDSSKFLCNPDTIRFNVSATDADPNDTLKLELVSSPGIFTTVNGPSPVSGTLKYYVTATGTYTFIFKVTDKCGAVDYDTASWFVIKDATTPVVTAPDSSKTFCGPDTIRFTVSATDANPYDTLKLYKYSGPGTFYPDTVKGNPPLSGTLKYYVTASGTYNFIFKTMDKCGRYDFDTATYVINMNTPPVVTAPDSSKFFCGPDTIRFTVTATDPNSGDTLTLSGPGIPTPIKGLSPLSANIKIYVSSAGTYNYIYSVTDKCGASDADTATWTITMNSPPVVTAPDSSKFFCGPDTIRYTVTATDPNSGDTLTLSGPGIPSPIKGLSPLSANIKIYVSSAGTYNYIYTVTDKCNASDKDTATYIITMNSPPVVTAPDNNKFICNLGDSVNFSVSATDPNTSQNLTLEKTSGPGSFATVNGVSPLSGTQKWAPASSGTYNFIYKITDACGAVDYDTATWVITFNTTPVVLAPDSSKFLCNPDTIRFNVSATDTDPNDTLKLELVSSPGIFTTVNGPSPVSGTLKYYVTATGTYTFIFKVTDKCGAVDYDTASWFVIKDATTPVVTAPDSSKTFCGPDTIRFTVSATDANPYDTLKLYKYSGPGTFYPDTVKGNPPLSGTLKYYVTASGTYNFIFKTMDKCGRYDFDTATYVINMNTPPVVTAPDSSKSFCGPDTVRFTVTATDPNSGDTLTLSGPGIPSPIKGLSPLSANIKIYVSSAGTYNYIYTVSDKCGSSDTDTATWTITMNSPPVVTVPDSSKFFCGPDTIRFTVTATDPNSGDTLTLSGPGIPSPINGLSPLSANVKIYVSSAGTYNYIYTVTDKCGASDVDTATWTITVNSPPVVTAPDSTKSFCGPDTVRFTVTATDPNSGDTLTLSGPGIPTPIKGFSPLSANIKIYVSSAGTYNYIYTVSDKCGASDVDTATWTITMNHPPTVVAPDSSKFFCGPDTIRFRVTANDPDAGDTITLSGPGISVPIKGVSPVYADVKFYISTGGTYNYVYQVTNHCGSAVYDTATWTITMNSAPTVTAPDSSKFFCGPDTIRFTVTATDPNSGDTLTLSGPGIPSPINGLSPLSANVKIYVSSAGTYNYIYTVTDKCGASDVDTATWTITVNSPPVVTAPDSTKSFCGPDTVRFTVTATDPNSGDTLTLSGPGIPTPIKGFSPLSANIKIYVSSAGTYNYIYTVSDKCGASDADTATWTITMNHPPTVVAPDSSKFFCGPDTIRFRVTANDPDAGDTITLSGPGISVPIKGVSPVYADVKFYISTGGTYNYVYQVTNHCGSAVYDTATWIITMNSAPVVTVPDSSKFFCGPDTIRFTVSATDPNSGDTLTLSGPGIATPIKGLSPLSANIKIYVSSAGTYGYIYTVTDKCGASDADTATWTITMNTPPIVTAPDSTKKLCQPDTIRFMVTATDAQSDSITLEGPGITPSKKGVSPLSAQVKFYISTAGTYTYIYKITDACGAVDYDTAVWNLSINHPPVVIAPDSSKSLCSPDTIRFCVTVNDPDVGDTLILEGPGIPSPKTGITNVSACVKFYISSSGTYNYAYKVTNGCGAVDYDTATWTVTINNPPTLNLPQLITACLGDTARLTVTGNDPDNNYNITLEKLSGVGNFITLNGKPPLSGSWTWVPGVSDTLSNPHQVIFKVTDHCGRSVTDTVSVIVQNCACDIFVKIGEDSCANPGDTVSIPVLLKTSVQIGGFDLRIEFDPTVLSFMKVTRGSGLPSGWEYFTYRQLPCPLCGCCKYKLLLLGIYDLKNTQAGVPIEPSSDYIEIARVKFQVSSNNNLRGFFSNVCFEWDKGNCTQNSFSDVSGYKLYVSSNPDQFSYADCDTQFDVGNEVLNRVCFEDCGGIQICTTGEKKRGDINLNLIAYEVADAVMFSSYFIYGTGVFILDPPVQIANTDINADGYPLSLSDFVLMLRIMTHDATPIPKPTPGSDLANIYVVTKGNETNISTNTNLGAALFIFKGDVKVSSDLKMEQGVVNNQTRVLVYMSGSGITGQLLTAKGKLVSVEAVDNFSRPVKTTVVERSIPTAYALNANYPNPFNPTTNISFALAEDSKVCLKIYNLSGQLVKTLVDANLTAGTYTVSWNGTNGSEDKVASGIYFYRLSAGSYNQTRKMCLIK